MKENANIWGEPWGFWPKLLCSSVRMLALISVPQWFNLDAGDVNVPHEFILDLEQWNNKKNLDVNTISNCQTPWITCSFSYLRCKKPTNQTKTKQKRRNIFISLFYIFLFWYMHPWESKLSVAHWLMEWDHNFCLLTQRAGPAEYTKYNNVILLCYIK